MARTTVAERREDMKQAFEALKRTADNLENNGGYLVITIKGTSKSNMSFRFDVRNYYTIENKVYCDYLNWTYAQLMEMKQNDRGEVKGGGLGIDRAFEVANNLERLIKNSLGIDLKIRYQGVY